jgi:hypothetical protein
MPSSCWVCGVRSGLHRVTALNYDAIKAYITAQVACGAMKDPQKRLRAPGPLSPGHRVCDKHMPPSTSTPVTTRPVEECAQPPPKKRPLDADAWSFHAKLDRDSVQAKVSLQTCSPFMGLSHDSSDYPHRFQINEWSSATGYHTRVIFTPSAMDLPEAAKRHRTITLFSRAPVESSDSSPPANAVRPMKERGTARAPAPSRVWHNGHKDLLIGDEMFHVAESGALVPHGNVWNLDDLLGLYGDDVVAAELSGGDRGFSGVKSPERFEGSVAAPPPALCPVTSTVHLPTPISSSVAVPSTRDGLLLRSDDTASLATMALPPHFATVPCDGPVAPTAGVDIRTGES